MSKPFGVGPERAAGAAGPRFVAAMFAWSWSEW